MNEFSSAPRLSVAMLLDACRWAQPRAYPILPYILRIRKLYASTIDTAVGYSVCLHEAIIQLSRAYLGRFLFNGNVVVWEESASYPLQMTSLRINYHRLHTILPPITEGIASQLFVWLCISFQLAIHLFSVLLAGYIAEWYRTID